MTPALRLEGLPGGEGPREVANIGSFTQSPKKKRTLAASSPGRFVWRGFQARKRSEHQQHHGPSASPGGVPKPGGKPGGGANISSIITLLLHSKPREGANISSIIAWALRLEGPQNPESGRTSARLEGLPRPAGSKARRRSERTSASPAPCLLHPKPAEGVRSGVGLQDFDAVC